MVNVNDHSQIESSVYFNECFKDNAVKTTSEMALLDTSTIDHKEATQIISQWILEQL